MKRVREAVKPRLFDLFTIGRFIKLVDRGGRDKLIENKDVNRVDYH